MLNVISLIVAVLSLCFSAYVFYIVNKKIDALKAQQQVHKIDKYDKYRNIDGLLSVKHIKDVKQYGKP